MSEFILTILKNNPLSLDDAFAIVYNSLTLDGELFNAINCMRKFQTVPNNYDDLSLCIKEIPFYFTEEESKAMLTIWNSYFTETYYSLLLIILTTFMNQYPKSNTDILRNAKSEVSRTIRFFSTLKEFTKTNNAISVQANFTVFAIQDKDIVPIDYNQSRIIENMNNSKFMRKLKYALYRFRVYAVIVSRQFEKSSNDPIKFGQTTIWIKNNLIHRENDPAIVCNDGLQIWCKNGKIENETGPSIYWNILYAYTLNDVLHRNDDLPALIDKEFNLLSWFTNGLLDRENGPAIICESTKCWYKQGKIHRAGNLPACMVDKNNYKANYYFVNGVPFSSTGYTMEYGYDDNFSYSKTIGDYTNSKSASRCCIQ